MRTKTMLLSALLGGLGSVSVMAQTNVYSQNTVGYINVTIYPGYNIVTCPLVCVNTNGVQDNSIGNVMNNAGQQFTGTQVYFYYAGHGYGPNDTAKVIGGKTGTSNANGWNNNGTNIAAPGVGFWVDSPASNTITFVGTVPSGPMTNPITAGFNLVGSIVPLGGAGINGDLASNTLSSLTNYNIGDQFYVYYPTNPPGSNYLSYTTASGKAAGHGYGGNWTANGDPIIPNVGQGFWYDAAAPVTWVENYQVSQ